MAAPVFRARTRFGLRTRLGLAFGLGALLLSAVLAAITFGLTRSNLLDNRAEDAVALAELNARQADRNITDETDDAAARQVLAGLPTKAESVPALLIDGNSYSALPGTFSVPDDINSQLQALVINADVRQAGQMRYRLNDEPYLVIGVPLTKRNSVYFEATPLSDIEDTLGSLGLALAGAAFVSTLFSLILAAWAARRVLQPLTEVSATAEALAAGDLSARLDVANDADLAPLGASFNEMADSLEERIERDARFASDVSHELRSPLMTISASLEVLNSRKAELSDRAQTALTLLTDDVERFSQLVEDLLEISRYEVGANALDVSEFGIVEFVRQAIRMSGHTVELIGTEDLEEVVVAADKRRLARVVVNLLDNASKYGAGQSTIRLTRIGNGLEMSVEDEGPGVPITEREFIFDRFARGSEGGRRGSGTGTGLGLALVSEHVQLHGGRVSVGDRLDGGPGARFIVSLPEVTR